MKLVSSHDLRAWTQVGGRAHYFPISVQGQGGLDTGQTLAASHPILHGDELWFYFTGIDVRYRPGEANSQCEWYHGAIHLAKLRRDGLVSMQAGVKRGFVEMLAVRFEGGRLFISVTITGQVSVEIMTQDEEQCSGGLGQGQVCAGHPRPTESRVEMAWPGCGRTERQTCSHAFLARKRRSLFLLVCMSLSLPPTESVRRNSFSEASVRLQMLAFVLDAGRSLPGPARRLAAVLSIRPFLQVTLSDELR